MICLKKERIEAARAELERRGGYIVNMPLGVASDDCFTPSAAALERASGLTVKRATGEFRYMFSGDFEQVIADLYTAIEGGEFDD